MELMFEVISRQKFNLGSNVSCVFGKVGGIIGRSNECEWVLPDKSKSVSRKHAIVSCDGSSFFIEDMSTNGIYTELGKERLKKGVRYKIDHGACFLIGEYSVQARLLHKPDAYLPPEDRQSDLIPDDSFLDLDPLVAMDQQENFEARHRLGLYDDLLGQALPAAVGTAQPDHTEPRLDSMLSLVPIPDEWDEENAEEETAQEQDDVPLGAVRGQGSRPTFHPEKRFDEPEREVLPVPETAAFFQTLGFQTIPESPEERERVLRQSAELLLASVDGILMSLRNRADSKNDLRLPVTTMTLASNNPLKFSPNSNVAIQYLLAQPQTGILPPTQAVVQAFEDLHGHHMGLLAGARAAVKASLEKVSPQQVENKLDASGPVRLKRASRLWSAYCRMHRALQDEHNDFSALFLQDFARAYEVQVRTLALSTKLRKGETS
jgi:type VI secretion system protein ImpI